MFCHDIHYILVVHFTSALALVALFKLSLTPIYVWSEVKLFVAIIFVHDEVIVCVTGKHDKMFLFFVKIDNQP